MQTTNLNRMKSMIRKEKKNSLIEKLRMFVYSDISNNIRIRAKQSNYVSQIMDTTKTPIILCGDFNDMPGTYTYNKLKSNLIDGFKNCGEGFASTYKGLENLIRIDYIFHSKEINSYKYKTIKYEMSDHNPVYIEVEI